MPIVALTGGVAAGKSTVSEVLEECGALVVDADLLAREAVSPGSPALAEIVERFGPGVIDSSGALDRGALGALIFGDDAARRALEEIIHPVVQTLSRARLQAAQVEDPMRVVVYVIPLLAESQRREEFDLVVVVESPAEVRADRLVEHRGLTKAEATRRLNAQATDTVRREIADVVLDSSQSVVATERQARELYAALAECWPDRLPEVPGLLGAGAS
jgi:dephospho-CoA kinase